jgi:hypothetical protein
MFASVPNCCVPTGKIQGNCLQTGLRSSDTVRPIDRNLQRSSRLRPSRMSMPLVILHSFIGSDIDHVLDQKMMRERPARPLCLVRQLMQRHTTDQYDSALWSRSWNRWHDQMTSSPQLGIITCRTKKRHRTPIPCTRRRSERLTRVST